MVLGRRRTSQIIEVWVLVEGGGLEVEQLRHTYDAMRLCSASGSRPNRGVEMTLAWKDEALGNYILCTNYSHCTIHISRNLNSR